MTQPTFYRRLTRLFSEGDQLRNIAVKAERLQALNAGVHAFLPEVFHARCQVANLQGNRLVLACEEGATATKLKFFLPDLLAHLQKVAEWAYIRSIDCKVLPRAEQVSALAQNPLQVPAREVAGLRALAETCESPELKAAIERLLKQSQDPRKQ